MFGTPIVFSGSGAAVAKVPWPAKAVLAITLSENTSPSVLNASFVAERGRQPVGFVLAHAVWNGLHPVVTSHRLATADPADGEALTALLQALTKSAYDAAAYHLHVVCPRGQSGLLAAGTALDFAAGDLLLMHRTLGSRGGRGAGDD